jgi:hypothetical protein
MAPKMKARTRPATIVEIRGVLWGIVADLRRGITL